ncbi:aminobutyraldehyde dehydrogenase [Leucobacter luti]|uniref:Aldehyde dehydrogenase (NAD+)/betaine-aldehyde dehydrogenase n=1 Tax=Leucobacter luti TaxID=340320 RepID=A0A4Q7TZY2_9MICO|nr:aminobutyraldehyde dehydrogenase [Leucobacter luti]MBL3699213.1 aldehyde dehydrogenase family protein [Leucobacter luti]RZT66711.1 aldehyde dehydrogenase (NAD+)/betaine-aldehyde dehydrogenase [Leucobacter luti]
MSETIVNRIGSVAVPGTGERFTTVNPATGEAIETYRAASEAEVTRAFAVAHAAFPAWKRITPRERQAVLLRFADAIEAHAEELLRLEITETGKPLAVTRELEVLRSADQLRFFAGLGRAPQGLAQTEYAEGFSSLIRREPVGVIAQVTPWNYPLMMAIWKIGPALAAGNTVVLKPAETTPSSTVALARIAAEVLPPGVFNVVVGGRATGRLLSEHRAADMVAITGSVRAGAEVMAAASRNITRVHLELGGKAPAIVFADADLDLAVRGIAAAGFFNAGQDCTAATRILVEASVATEFLARLKAHTATLRTGGPDTMDAFHGPLNSAAQFERVQGVLGRLPAHVVVEAGGYWTEPGFFLKPTVLSGVRQDDEVVQSELFAPILTVQEFHTEDEAIELANGVDLALAASLWTRNHGRATELSGALEFGTVWINCHQVIPAEMPHGGYKASGLGKDLSIYGYEDYTRIKHVMSAHAR